MTSDLYIGHCLDAAFIKHRFPAVGSFGWVLFWPGFRVGRFGIF